MDNSMNGTRVAGPNNANVTVPPSVASAGSAGKAKKKVNKSTIAIIVSAIVACAGIGFGIFEMILHGEANQKTSALAEELDQKNEALKQAEDKLGAQIEVTPDEGKEEITDVKVSAARDYIYVGEWGIKIKIPDNLTSVSYVFTRAEADDGLYITAVTKGGQYVPSFLANSLNRGTGLVAIGRYRKDAVQASSMEIGSDVSDSAGNFLGNIVYVDDEYVFTYSRGNGIMSDNNQSDMEWERESTAAVEEMVKTGVSAF